VVTATEVKAALQKHANADDAVFLQRFFKTGPGQYGAGDKFIGVRVPRTRQVCKQFKDLPLAEVQKLLDSPVHEYRLAAVIILANMYPKAPVGERQKIYNLYLKNLYRGRINNWDIVDVTVEAVVGAHLENRDRKVLFELARSDDVWQKRAALLATFRYIKRGDPSTTFDLIDILLYDSHDLIQKAVGWMLREIGKRVDERLLTDFLDKHAHDMPRTALRYSLEKLSPQKKTHYMSVQKKSK
jgi:3-methyladenine DNA glycosylase AlkD